MNRDFAFVCQQCPISLHFTFYGELNSSNIQNTSKSANHSHQILALKI